MIKVANINGCPDIATEILQYDNRFIFGNHSDQEYFYFFESHEEAENFYSLLPRQEIIDIPQPNVALQIISSLTANERKELVKILVDDIRNGLGL